MKVEGKMPTARTRNLAEEVARIQPALPRTSKRNTATSTTTHANTDTNTNMNNTSTSTSLSSSEESEPNDTTCVKDVYSFPSTTGIGFDILLQTTRHGGHSNSHHNTAATAGSLPSKSQSKSKSKLQPQPFSHLLVCDFEATCDAASPHYRHEIIEFPVVCIDTSQLGVVAEFHSFVRPTRQPILTEFCTALTGITQATVEAAPTLPEVLRQFQNWLISEVYPLCKAANTNNNNNNNNIPRLHQQQQREFVYDETHHPEWVEWEKRVCFATDGPWDMRKFMHECSVLRDGHEFPPIFYRWVNVRHSFSEHFRTRPRKLTDMLRKLGMCFHGHQHSGIDDARNIARILIELLRRGHRIRHVSTIKYAPRGGCEGKMSMALAELMEEFDTDEIRPSRSNGKKKQNRKHRKHH